MGGINLGRMAPLEWNTFIAVLGEPNREKIETRIKGAYQNYYYQISDDCFLISTPEITKQVSIEIGLDGEDRIEEAHGVVFKLNGSHAGRSYQSLWDWMDQAEARRGHFEPST